MDLHNDDQPVGRVLTRREMLALLGGSGMALLAGLGVPQMVTAQSGPTPTPTSTPFPVCVVRPELAEGPYFVDEQLERLDVRVDPRDESIREGTPLHLVFALSDMTGGACVALEGAQVDIWHCDAEGVYSGVRDPRFDTTGQMWLRGYQLTDEEGIAKFLTIVPGWYSGRAVHIHFKIQVDMDAEAVWEFTSQLFFDPEQIEEAYELESYAERGLPDVPNERDGIYRQSDGVLTLDMQPMTGDELEELELASGYTATFSIGLDLGDADVGASDRWRRGRS